MIIAARNMICICAVILLFGILCFGLPALSTAANPSDSLKIEILDAKVDLIQKINERLLQTVYWTLAILAAIFLGLISVNLYFNISANKREIEKIREEIETLARNLIKAAEIDIGEKNSTATKAEMGRIKEEIANITKSEIKTSEANLIEKTNDATQREIEKTATNILNTAKNEILITKADITKFCEDSGRKIDSVASSVNQDQQNILRLEIRVKELEAYKFSKEGQMGAIIRQVDLLEYDLANRRWNLKFRLPEILNEVTKAELYPDNAEKLKALLGEIKDKEYQEIVKNISDSIVLRKIEEPKDQSK